MQVSWMCKRPLEHLNFQAPRLPYDYRFTVSLEEPGWFFYSPLAALSSAQTRALTRPVLEVGEDSVEDSQATLTRTKARKSFSQGLWKVEATSVDAIDHLKGTVRASYVLSFFLVGGDKKGRGTLPPNAALLAARGHL